MVFNIHSLTSYNSYQVSMQLYQHVISTLSPNLPKQRSFQDPLSNTGKAQLAAATHAVSLPSGSSARGSSSLHPTELSPGVQKTTSALDGERSLPEVPDFTKQLEVVW